MRKNMIATHKIDNIQFSANLFILEVNGKRYELNLNEVSKKLLHANEIERNFFKISPSGYGIHWPLIDEDLAVDSLIVKGRAD
ncbi:MAG TPA: DUF2442 domain-containing protein [Pelobium sp.]|nr:DUF2442 domain-containing protein [Pelobium sp.]